MEVRGNSLGVVPFKNDTLAHSVHKAFWVQKLVSIMTLRYRNHDPSYNYRYGPAP